MCFGVIVIIAFAMFGEVVTTNVNDTSNRIYNGIKAKNGDFPFTVCVVKKFMEKNHLQLYSCTGSLIALDTVLTAAHCLMGLRPENIFVLAGTTNCVSYIQFQSQNNGRTPYKVEGAQESIAKKLYVHPMYSRNIYVDVGIVKLAKFFHKTHLVRTIQYTTEELPGSVTCAIPGFGVNEDGGSAILYSFSTWAVQKSMVACGDTNNLLSSYFYCIKKDVSSTCAGDSGAPLVCNNKVYAVYSAFYFKFDEQQNCGAPGFMKFFKLSTHENVKSFLVGYSKGIDSNNQESRSCNIVPQCYTFAILIFVFLQRN